MFSTLPNKSFNISATIILLCAYSFNLEWSKILSFGKELTPALYALVAFVTSTPSRLLTTLKKKIRKISPSVFSSIKERNHHLAALNLSSANVLNLVMSKNLLFGKDLDKLTDTPRSFMYQLYKYNSH